MARLARRLPKVELHVHLEGSLTAERLRAIAERDGLDLDPAVLDPVGAAGDRSFAAFLRSFLARYFALRTPDDYAGTLDDLMRAQDAQNVAYTEAFFTPEGALRGRYVLRDVLAAMAEVESDWRRRGRALRLLVDGPRTLGPEVCTQLFRLAAADATGLCVGVGIGGDEVAAPGTPFAAAFDLARDAGLRRAVHAGEHGDAQEVAVAVDLLHAERIGHGVTAAGDGALLDRLRAGGVAVDCCPTSNRCTGAWDPVAGPHPVRRFLDAGLVVDIGSDDPACFHTCVSDEWAWLMTQGTLSPHECIAVSLRSLDAAFVDDATRQRLHASFEADLVDLRDEAAALEEELAR